MGSARAARAARLVAAPALLSAALVACSAAWGLRPGESRAWIREWRPGTVEWDVIATAGGGREVVIGYLSSCGMRNVRASARERARSVDLRVSAEYGVWESEPPGAVISCPAPRHAQLAVALRRPLAGRTVDGRPPRDIGRLYGGGCDRRAVCSQEAGAGTPVPQLAGLSPRQAVHALALAGLEARLRRRRAPGGAPRVIAERPRAGRPVARGSAVTVVVSGA